LNAKLYFNYLRLRLIKIAIKMEVKGEGDEGRRWDWNQGNVA
jgi:hypothetical protein